MIQSVFPFNNFFTGGTYGYQEFLDKIANPNHEEHEEMIEWLEGCGYNDFDPAKFNPADVTFFGYGQDWED